MAEDQIAVREDTFCGLVKGLSPAIVISKDLSITQDPFSQNAHCENLLSKKALTAINLFPPVVRIVRKSSDSNKSNTSPPMGLSLVHLFTNHYSLPEEVPDNEWLTFFLNYRMTVNACLNHKKISSYKQSVIQTFFNIGERSGASIPHLHGQTVLFWNQQGGGTKSDTYRKSSYSTPNGCTKCQLWLDERMSSVAQSLNLQERLIIKNAHWMAFLAYAPEKDAQIRILPKRHISAFWDLNDEELTDLVPVLIKSNQMLTNFINTQGGKYQLIKDRNIIIRQFEQDIDNQFHMFIDILPVQQLGGAETIDNQKFSCIFPETIAKIMRE